MRCMRWEGDVWDEPEPTLLLTQGIFNHPHHIDMVWEGYSLWWRCKLYTVWKWIAAQLNIIAVTGESYPCPQALTHWAIFPAPPRTHRRTTTRPTFNHKSSDFRQNLLTWWKMWQFKWVRSLFWWEQNLKPPIQWGELPACFLRWQFLRSLFGDTIASNLDKQAECLPDT